MLICVRRYNALAFPLHFGAIGFVIGGMVGMLGAAIMMIFRMRTLSKRY